MQPRHCLQPEQDEGQAVEVEAGWLKSVCHDGKKRTKKNPIKYQKAPWKKPGATQTQSRVTCRPHF